MTYWLYLILTTLAPLLPQRFGYWLFGLAGNLAFYLGKKQREAYLKNLKHILGPEADPARMTEITRRAFRNLLKSYYDLFRSHRLTEPQLRAMLADISGVEHLQAALAEGKGLIAGSPHFGNYNLFIQLAAIHLRQHGHVVVPSERLRPERLFELIRRQRASQGIEIVPVDQAPRALIKALRSGNIAGLAIDLDITESGQVVDFFGAPARLPVGAATLALKYGAPLVLGFARRLEDNRCVVVIEPPIVLERTTSPAADIRAGVERIARRLEYWIGQYPEEWMMFQPIWEQDK